jgi:hypothetical protein
MLPSCRPPLGSLTPAGAPLIDAENLFRQPGPPLITLVLEGIGHNKIRINSPSLDHPLVILADPALEIVAIEKKTSQPASWRSAYWLNHDPTGMVEAGHGPATK